ncbi:hypothetical protein FOCC_FOCC011477 [Frankliniella occidentalis]|uniref:Myb-like, SWIRM and MPN domain-containing protein 1 n=1 Tax=Frankliniella occidentalis TaxID=133901 RepID=A0A6J1S3G1_FRAOC|nr:histone H2A deubiquitinase MYSM1-like [Frankliniella occidentalis]KAE8742925.1 hypothetical protein FOCC_FOCC011477 [Frankliniella occidentalis]
MADDDEVDILGDFNLENLLTKDENRLASCYDGGVGSDLLQCDYPSSWYLDVGSPPWYERSQLDPFSPLPFSLPPSSSPNNLQWSDPSVGSPTSSGGNSTNWTDKERSLLEEGLELFGRSWSRLSQFIGTKTAYQIKSYLKLARPSSESETLSVSISSSTDGNLHNPTVSAGNSNISYTELIDDLQIPASMEEVIAVVSTAQTTISTNQGNMHKTSEGTNNRMKKRRIKPTQNTKAKRGRPPRVPVLSPPVKRGRGRPRKLQGGSTTDHSAEQGKNINVISELTETPRLGEEVVRIRSLSSDDSDVDIDIEDEEDKAFPEIKKESEEFVSKLDITSSKGVSVEEKMNSSLSSTQDLCLEHLSEEKTENIEEPLVKMEKLESTSTGKETKTLISHQDILDQIYQLPPPKSELILRPDEILDEEQSIHAEFFEGRPAKTPRRYLKIRNHIIDCWLQSKPIYVTKTSVRAGLRNCGDVNCIGRIHSYLEQIGAINFGCEQTKYNHAPTSQTASSSKVVALSSVKEKVNRELLCIEGMRPRKKKQEIDEDLMGSTDGGYTILHKDDGQTFLTYNSMVKPKVHKPDSSIKLLYCSKFSSEKPAPFTVHLHVGALLVIDVHAHCSHNVEVMGLLGGELREDSLHIVQAVSCQASRSSSTHCDMCPVSQSEASDKLSKEGLSVVGWYHSHPTFVPNPSLQDLSTQAEMQRWFSDTKAAPFVGLILSPYCSNTTSFASIFRVLVVDPEGESGGTPYRFPVNIVAEDVDVAELLGHVDGAITSMRKPSLDGPLYSHSPDVPALSCFHKCRESIRKHLESCQPPLSPDLRRRILEGILEICKIRCNVDPLKK